MQAEGALLEYIASHMAAPLVSGSSLLRALNTDCALFSTGTQPCVRALLFVPYPLESISFEPESQAHGIFQMVTLSCARSSRRALRPLAEVLWNKLAAHAMRAGLSV